MEEGQLKKQKITNTTLMAIQFWFHLIFPHLSLKDWIAMKRVNRAFSNYEKLNGLIKSTEEECFGDIPKRYWDRSDCVDIMYRYKLEFFEKHTGKFILLIVLDTLNQKYRLRVCISKEELIQETERIFCANSARMIRKASYHTSYCVVVRAEYPNCSSFVICDFYLSGVKLEELNLIWR
jgi:hypothetical protein